MRIAFMLCFFCSFYCSAQEVSFSFGEIGYVMKYSFSKEDTMHVIHCLVKIYNHSSEDFYIPSGGNLYPVPPGLLVQRNGGRYKDLMNMGNTDGVLMVLHLLRARKEMSYEVSCKIRNTDDIREIVTAIDFVAANKLNEKDLIFPDRILVDGRPITNEKDAKLIQSEKYDKCSIFFSSSLSVDFIRSWMEHMK